MNRRSLFYLSLFVGVLAASALLITCDSGGTGGTESCTTSGDCSKAGSICAGGTCVPCQADPQCTADYGEGATCVEGICTASECLDGTLDCPCSEDGACTEGECVAGSCLDCERGDMDCACYANDTCNAGSVCVEGICVLCPAGELNCPCNGDACGEDLVCMNDVCVQDPCPPGTEGCPCNEGDICEGALHCGDDGLCAQCSPDLVGCPCDEGACLNDLVCDEDDDICREAIPCEDADCAEHQDCEETDGEDAVCLESCVEGWIWDGENGICEPSVKLNCQDGEPGSILEDCQAANRECVEADGTAACTDCLVGFTDEDGALDDCRMVLTCDDLPCETQHRHCTPETDNGDAACGDCFDAWMDDPDGGDACVEVPPATCAPDVPGSIVEQCALANRACYEDEIGAYCGDCLEGYSENEFNDCIPEATCEELGCAEKNTQCLGAPPFQFCGGCIDGTIPTEDPTICAAPVTCMDLVCEGDMYCVENDPLENASCVEDPCEDPMYAWSESSAACVLCDVDCNDSDEGETGRIWPYTKTGSESCICETEPGYYWDDGDRVGRPCDEDGDGWIRSAAQSSIESDDPWLKLNARCSLRTIDRFVLRNEYQQELEIFLCVEAPTIRREDLGECVVWNPVPLYESVRNDKQQELDLALETDAPAYAADNVGRRLRAAEVNPLTKACTATGDYNHNGVSDLTEWHDQPQGTMSASEYLFARFSYWMELHTSAWEPAPGGAGAGRYVIFERSRCDAATFPPLYADAEGGYWRSCTRSRDTAWDPTDGPAGPDFGTDFAEWSCDDPLGSCPIPPPPTNELPTLEEWPVHGLCDVPLPPVDAECADPSSPWLCVDGGVWRGMSHHSQFRCVRVSLEESIEDPVLHPSLFAKHYTLNSCRVECPESDPSCALDCQDGPCSTTSVTPLGGANPSDPVFTCSPLLETPQPETVGLALVRYHDEVMPPYQRGCINEYTPTSVSGDLNGSEDPVTAAWRSLCPGWTDDPDATFGDAQVSNFGLIQCGCGDHYGGPGCTTGCASDELHLSPGYEVAPRTGWWMCGNLSPYTFMGEHPDLGTVPVPEATGINDAVNPPSTWTLRTDPRPPITDRAPLCQNPLFCNCPEVGDCDIGYVIR